VDHHQARPGEQRRRRVDDGTRSVPDRLAGCGVLGEITPRCVAHCSSPRWLAATKACDGGTNMGSCRRQDIRSVRSGKGASPSRVSEGRQTEMSEHDLRFSSIVADRTAG
jgi:hypothetical protein